MSGVLFCSISRGSTILCSKSTAEGNNFSVAAESKIQNIPISSNIKTTYTGDDHYVFHVVVENGLIYLCVSDANYRKARAFAFLEEIVRRFTGGSLIVRANSAGYMELQKDFTSVLSTQMTRFSKDEGDQISQLQSQVNEVKGVMTQNIDRVLQRGEKLDDLIDKTTDLEASTNTFKKTSRAVARKYWWQNLKMKIILAVVIFVILAIIVFIILSQTVFKNPPASSGSATTAPTTVATTKHQG